MVLLLCLEKKKGKGKQQEESNLQECKAPTGVDELASKIEDNLLHGVMPFH
jgi:hypothetical protein